ncbi:DAK2 domain-containing protein [Chloroflexota bacterium]
MNGKMQETAMEGKTEAWSGHELREMFTAATMWLKKSAPDINALNVFPIPDGDCGTNMLLTMRSTLEEAHKVPDHSASAVAKAMAHGSLMGARGNSGVILSRIFHGLAIAFEGRKSFNGSDFAGALAEGASAAYKALAHPVEGTMLTVARESANAALSAGNEKTDLLYILENTVKVAGESVANTPSLLPVLKEAGVVDAGGQGLYVLLEGCLLYLRGEAEEMQYRQPQVIPGSIPLVSGLPWLTSTEKEEPYGYCTEFVLEGNKKLNPERIKKRLDSEGQCLIVAGDEHLVHIHIHTFDPGKIIRYATSLGVLHEIKIQNMDDQHREFTERTLAQAPLTEIATVAVVSGEGLMEVFRSLGITAVVPGGQTMNPSTGELLQAIDSLPQNKVILLPNNKNIIPAAEQTVSLTSKEIRVVPTETVPQGVAALLSLDYDADLETNASQMSEAGSAIKTVEITRAVRSTKIGNTEITQGQAIGFIDGDLTSAGESPGEVLYESLLNMNMEEREIITLYYGSDSTEPEVEEVADRIRQKYPHLEVETIHGGQPHYDYLVSVE